jgi:hypothetical protein
METFTIHETTKLTLVELALLSQQSHIVKLGAIRPIVV